MDETRVSRLTGILAALALACLPSVTVAQGARVPVIAGQDGPDYDACGSQGVVQGLDPKGNWFGVVYTHKTRDCAVGTPWPRAGAYSGPCLSGWVYRKFVGGLAG